MEIFKAIKTLVSSTFATSSWAVFTEIIFSLEVIPIFTIIARRHFSAPLKGTIGTVRNNIYTFCAFFGINIKYLIIVHAS